MTAAAESGCDASATPPMGRSHGQHIVPPRLQRRRCQVRRQGRGALTCQLSGRALGEVL